MNDQLKDLEQLQRENALLLAECQRLRLENERLRTDKKTSDDVLDYLARNAETVIKEWKLTT